MLSNLRCSDWPRHVSRSGRRPEAMGTEPLSVSPIAEGGLGTALNSKGMQGHTGVQ